VNGVCRARAVHSAQVLLAMRIVSAAGARVGLKLIYGVAPVEFWQENVDKPGWDC